MSRISPELRDLIEEGRSKYGAQNSDSVIVTLLRKDAALEVHQSHREINPVLAAEAAIATVESVLGQIAESGVDELTIDECEVPSTDSVDAAVAAFAELKRVAGKAHEVLASLQQRLALLATYTGDQ